MPENGISRDTQRSHIWRALGLINTLGSGGVGSRGGRRRSIESITGAHANTRGSAERAMIDALLADPSQAAELMRSEPEMLAGVTGVLFESPDRGQISQDPAASPIWEAVTEAKQGTPDLGPADAYGYTAHRDIASGPRPGDEGTSREGSKIWHSRPTRSTPPPRTGGRKSGTTQRGRGGYDGPTL